MSDTTAGTNWRDLGKKLLWRGMALLAWAHLLGWTMPFAYPVFTISLPRAASVYVMVGFALTVYVLLDGKAVLDTIESFLVRRALCEHEPTGLHAVFKRLWADCSGSPTAATVLKAISANKTVKWPRDPELDRSLNEVEYYKSAITPYFLAEYNRSLGGDVPTETGWVEHVLPQTLPGEGWEAVSPGDHKTWVDRLGNLTLLSSATNRDVSNKPYREKRITYQKDSSFKMSRELGKASKTWTVRAIETRAAKLAEWAKSRWPHFPT